MKVKEDLDKIVYDRIIDSFILGEYKMGNTISLSILCERYEVGRAPVVRTMKLLISDGTLEKLSNGCVVVPIFDQNQIKDIYDIKLIIREHAMEHYLSAATSVSSLLDQLEIRTKEYEGYLDEGDFLELSKTGLRFHRMLISGTRNEYLSELHKRIQDQFLAANYLIPPLGNRDFRSTADDHCRLLEYLRNGDIEQSERMVAGHVNSIFYITANQKQWMRKQ